MQMTSAVNLRKIVYDSKFNIILSMTNSLSKIDVIKRQMRYFNDYFCKHYYYKLFKIFENIEFFLK